jgi:hypothetical protein
VHIKEDGPAKEGSGHQGTLCAFQSLPLAVIPLEPGFKQVTYLAVDACIGVEEEARVSWEVEHAYRRPHGRTYPCSGKMVRFITMSGDTVTIRLSQQLIDANLFWVIQQQ